MDCLLQNAAIIIDIVSTNVLKPRWRNRNSEFQSSKLDSNGEVWQGLPRF